MKKILLLAVIALTAVSAMAELSGSGFYRLQNAYTKRYAYLLDNKGKVDYATSSADVNALKLYKDFVKASSDPSTIFYVESQGDNYYNVGTQGADLYSFFGSFLKILGSGNVDGKPAYRVYAQKSGMVKYLADNRSDDSREDGVATVDETSSERRNWWIDNVNPAGDNYFGILPTQTAGGKYYGSIYAGFPFATYSSGMKAYVVSRVEPTYGVAVITEVTGKIAAGTPVIMECAGPLAADNRLTIGPDGANTSIPANYLRGVYFDNDEPTHYNRTPYDKNSMRSLGVVDGKLAFVKGNYDFMPRNVAVLQLPDAAACAIDNYIVMTEDEFQAHVASLDKHNPDGYYRMQNAATKRYGYILDNAGGASDVNALQLYTDLVKANSDPASVMYLSRPSGAGVFDRHIAAQGTNSQAIFGGTLAINPAGDVDGLQAYTVATSAGNIGDAATDSDKGQASVGASGNASLWYFNPINNDANYFGVAPTVTAGGKYYRPFMADFPVAAASEGVKFYTVSKIDTEIGTIVLQPVSGVIPAGTPVIVECVNPLAADNRLSVGAEGTAADVSGNLLQAVYYNIAETGHVNRTPYDAQSMRSLTVSPDGKLVFAASSDEFVPRNEAYIVLSDNQQKAVAQYTAMTADEYAAYSASLSDLMPDGYYRMQNATTGRNLYIIDSKGSIKNAESSDLGALALSSDPLKASSDPAAILSFSMIQGSDVVPSWSVSSQSVAFSNLAGASMKLLPAGDDTFDAYVMKGGSRIFFSDATPAGDADGALTTSASANAHQWKLLPVDPAGDNYFGITPTVAANGKYFHPFVASFPYSAYSEGVKFYYIYKVDATNKVIVRKEIEGTVPVGIPVIVECENPLATDNRLNIGETADMATVKGNLLKVNWFDSDVEGHVNRTAYDKQSMRVLREIDGRLMFVVADDLEYLPRNEAYIQLTGTKPQSVDQYVVLTPEEYEATHGVASISEDMAVDVYRIDGTLVRSQLPKTEINSLPAGIYLLRCGDTCEKHLVR